ncbi:DUF1214 domain-containing protein [Paractinoplanes atraurantiacus]|uniref:DUF1214 domain-containing protein n=1 Tax=Paractinoplanes atraurantiacus TaxID=1036182 RepID=UPI001C53478E|nr:DUF1214 domain-containing protein [Actinoplanes atraurantiacus]
MRSEPGYDAAAPNGYQVRRLLTDHFLVCTRAPFPDPEQGKDYLRTVKLYPLAEAGDPPPNDFTDTSGRQLIANPCEVDGTFGVWEALKRALDLDPLLYDLDTRSEINTEQFKPVLTSLRDDLTPNENGDIVLDFGPSRPAQAGVPWLRTDPGAQWFAYFRVYGPAEAAFDGSWKPSDFHKTD